MKKIKNRLVNYLKQRKLILLVTLVYTTIITTVCLHRFWQYEALYYDHGLMETTAYQVSQFKIPLHHREFGKVPIYVDHLYPSLQLVLAPFYWLYNSYETPIVVQSILIGSSVLIAYEVANSLIKNKLMIYALLFAYMFYIGMQNAIIFLVHDITLQIPFLMLLFLALVKNKKRWFFLLLLINLGFKESVSVTMFTLGFCLVLFKKTWRNEGWLTILIATLYGFGAMKFISYLRTINFARLEKFTYTPDFGRQWYQYLINFVDTQQKRETIFVSLASFGFLPLFSPFALLLLIQDWAQRFVLINPYDSYRQGLNLHYNANLVVLLFVGAVFALNKLETKKWYQKVINYHALIIFLLVAIYHRLIYHGPLGLIYNPDFFKITQNMKFMDEFVAKIPRQGKIMVQNNLACRFTHNDLYLLLSEKEFNRVSPDVIALDFRPGQSPTNYWPMNENGMKELAQKLLEDKNYTLIYRESHRFIFVKKGYQGLKSKTTN